MMLATSQVQKLMDAGVYVRIFISVTCMVFGKGKSTPKTDLLNAISKRVELTWALSWLFLNILGLQNDLYVATLPPPGKSKWWSQSRSCVCIYYALALGDKRIGDSGVPRCLYWCSSSFHCLLLSSCRRRSFPSTPTFFFHRRCDFSATMGFRFQLPKFWTNVPQCVAWIMVYLDILLITTCNANTRSWL